MNTDTGQIKALAELTEGERSSGKWKELNEWQVLELAPLKESERLKRMAQLEGLRKPGRR